MRVIVTVRVGSEGGFIKSQECDLDAKDADRLKSDWTQYVSGKSDILGGVYRYHHRGDEERSLFLKFGDVLLIE